MFITIVGLPLPIRFRPDTPMSDDELLRFCSANELLHVERQSDGQIRLKLIAGCQASLWNVEIISQLCDWAKKDGRGETFANAGFSLPDGSMFGAYAAWMENFRWNALNEQQREGFAPTSPDFVIELCSPFDKLSELQEKMELWIANGVQLAWLIDPLGQSIYIYHSGQTSERLNGPVLVRGVGVMAGFELETSSLYQTNQI